MAEIQFIKGITEESIPDVRMTRSRDGTNGKAIFYFENPKAVEEGNEQITGMYLIDEEGELNTQEVKGKFVNGQLQAIEAIYPIRSTEEWDRFMRFMERYAQENNLEFSKS
jgi:photosystem II protein